MPDSIRIHGRAHGSVKSGMTRSQTIFSGRTHWSNCSAVT